MLNQQTLQRLRALKLTGMADAFAQQLEQPPTQQLSFEERLALLVDRERTHRDNRRLQRLLRSAHLKQQACVEEIDYQAPRGLVLAITCTSQDRPALEKAGSPAPLAMRLAGRG